MRVSPSRSAAILGAVALVATACGASESSGYGPRLAQGDDGAAQEGQDLGIFPGRPVTFADTYAARANVVQTVAAPLVEGDWDGNGWIFAANEVGQGVSVYDLKSLTPIEFVYSPDNPVPHHPYLSPDQRWVSANARFGSSVIVIDTHDGFETTFLEFPEAADGEDVAGPLHGTYTSDSGLFLVALQRSDRLGVIDFTGDEPEIVEVIDLGDRPRDVYITPDDAKAFITMQGENTVAVVDVGTWDVRYIERSDSDYSSAGGGGGGMSEDGRFFAASNTPDDEVVIIDTGSEEVVHRIEGIPMPVNAEFLGNTSIVGTGNRSDGSASFMDAETGELLATVETGGGANIPYMGPDGHIWISHNGADFVSVLDPETFEVVDEVGTGQNPHWIHFLPSGSRALVTNWGEATLSVIDTIRRTEIQKVLTGLNPNGIIVKTDVTPEQAEQALARGLEDDAPHDVELASEMVLPDPRDDREQLFLNTCAQCHDIGRIIRNNTSSEEGWREIVVRMKGNGAQMTDEEMEEITAYLTDGQHQELEVGTRYDEQHAGAETDEGVGNTAP
jgi:YVTN family beta-propeller protein